MSEYHCAVCQKCGSDMTVPDDLEDTGFCNPCAQNIAVAAEAFVVAHNDDFHAMKDSKSMDVDPNFMGLCYAVLAIEEPSQ